MCVACAASGLNSWASPATSSGAGPDLLAPAAAVGTSSSQTGNPYIDGLISGHRWSGAISYSFPNSASSYGVGTPEAAYGIQSVSFAQMQAARFVLEGRSAYGGGPKMTMTAFEQFTNASIAEAALGTGAIRIATSASADPTAYAYLPGTAPSGGDVWFGTAHNYANPRLGTYEYATMAHELGHALGLKHGHETGGVANTAVPADRDSMEFTVMTYRSYVGHASNGYTNETFGFAQTFMMLDIAALQQMYGANFSTRSGDSTYRWNPTTGEASIDGVGQGAPGGGAGGSANRVFLTVWDGGGNDTYDFSNYGTNLTVDLAPGGWSILSATQLANLGDGRYARGNVFNAMQHNGDPRSLIENAIGGGGHDAIRGNAAANALTGRAGNDTLTGGAGNDTLDGGLGVDTARFSGQWADYRREQISADTWRVTDLRDGSPDGVDTLVGIETLRFADGAVAPDSQAPPGRTITGTSANDLLRGGAADDTLSGGLGDDTLDGSTGADRHVGGAGNDLYFVDNALDRVVEAEGDGTDMVRTGVSWTLAAGSAVESVGTVDWLATTAINIAGNEFANNLYGNNGANVLSGGGGRDVLHGRGGDDTIEGGSGDDSLYGGAGQDLLVGGSGNDAYWIADASGRVVELAGGGVDTVRVAVSYTLAAEADVECLATVDWLATTALNLTGNGGANTVCGNAGANVLTGGGGADRLYGRNGNDTLEGGAGRDVLYGEAGADVFLFREAADSPVGLGWDVVVGWDAGDRIVLRLIDVDPTLDGAQGFQFLGRGAADLTVSAGGLKYYQAAGNTFLVGDVTGDGVADFQLEIRGQHTIAASQLMLLG